MGREIRRVPVDWKHPVEHNPYWEEQTYRRIHRGAPASQLHRPDEKFVPLLCGSLSKAQAEWDEEYAQWKARTGETWEFHSTYHSKHGWVDRDGNRSFIPIRFWSEDGNTVVEECWVEDVEYTDERFFANAHWDRPAGDGYMPDFGVPDEELGWCLYETVSEGTPVTPVFTTAEELIDHLCTVGQDWDQKPMRRAAAEALVHDGWAPSGMAIRGRFYMGDTDADLIKAAGAGEA